VRKYGFEQAPPGSGQALNGLAMMMKHITVEEV
jgi:hypothetical protein